MGELENRKYIRIGLNLVIPVLTLYLICVWGVRLLVFFMPFVIGWVIAMIANPFVRFLERRLSIVRKHSSAALIVGVLALVITGIYLLIGWSFRELSGFVRELPELYEKIRLEVALAVQSLERVFNLLPQEAEQSLLQMAERFSASIADFLQTLAASAGGAVARTLPEVFVSAIMMLLSSYLFLAEHEKLKAMLVRHTPKTVCYYWGLLKKDIRSVIGGYFLAQFKIMFVVAGVLLVGFLLLRVHYSVLLAIGIAVLDFLPMFGTGTALIPWALVELFAGEYLYAFNLVLLYVVSQAVRQLIQPKIVGDSMGLPPLLTLFLLYIGFKFRGIAGMILAVPVGLICMKFYEYGAFGPFLENLRLLWEEIQRLRKE